MRRRAPPCSSLLAVAALAAGCGGDGAGTPIDAGRPDGRAPDAGPRPMVFGGDRPVMLQPPSDFDPARRYPLLLILHGFGASGFVQQQYLQLADAADAADALVLAPDGTLNATGERFWNADPACCDLGGSGVDDVAYLGGVLDDVIASWPVDPARVWVVGHSNGGFMAYRMACERADVITAIAGLAGRASSLPCAPARPVHVLHMHGDLDAVVPYGLDSFMGVPSPGAVASVAQWAGHNGCGGAPTPGGARDLDSALLGAETTTASTAGCPADGAAELWTIVGGSHVPALVPTFGGQLLDWLAAHPR